MYVFIVLEKGYVFGKMDGIMDIKHLTRKCAHMNIMERFFISEITKKNNELNDKNTVSYIFIFIVAPCTCLPARETTYTNAGYAATTILIRKCSYFNT